MLDLHHWQNKHPCHQCDCQRPVHKKNKRPDGKSFKLLKEEDQDWEYVSPEQALLAKRSDHPVFSVPTVSSAMVMGDSLHILYSRGVASHLAGSLLHYMCFFDGVGKRQRVNPHQRLQRIFAGIKELYVQLQSTSRLSNLRLSMLCDAAKPYSQWACLEAKAAETKQDHGFTLLSFAGWKRGEEAKREARAMDFEWGSITIRRRQRWVASWNGYRPTRLASSSMMTGSSGRVLAQWGLGVCSAPKPQEKQFSCLQECAAGSSACGTSSKSMIGVEELAAWNVQLLNILNCSMA